MDPRLPRLRRELAAIPFQEARVAVLEAEHHIVLPGAIGSSYASSR